jgi:2-polyprenyl-3-methyl-5-hydroxy-6-metoxy-1,4-benzoquinol methylase
MPATMLATAEVRIPRLLYNQYSVRDMSDSQENMIINEHTLNLEQLRRLREKPAPFTPGEALFWDDAHISKQMLAAHLDASTEAASRRPEIIARSVAWIMEVLGLRSGDMVLDLGCGPGLYASHLAQRGVNVTGIDYSRRSIDYAVRDARERQLDITYRYENYLEMKDEQRYDTALLIYGDFCPLNPERRALLLQNVHRALKPNGYFILDVSTRTHRKRTGWGNGWSVVESGFWKPGPHLLLEEGFDYPEQAIFLNQAIVLELDGTLSVYRMWFQDYSRESIIAELEAGGFAVESVWGDLTGAAYSEDGEWIGVVARKV